MKKEIKEEIEVPEGISGTFEDGTLKLKKDSQEVVRKVNRPDIEIKIKGNKLILEAKKGNRTQYKVIKTLLSHIKNTLYGLSNPFVYKLESASVHFPLTLKVEGDYVIIDNFLGEKVPRKAKIVPGSEVKINGQEITITSYDKEAAGQTAANLEQATKVTNRDPRIFQDGVYITEKPKINYNEMEEELE